VQLAASTDHLRTWIDLYSLVDHFTIAPTFVGIYYDRNWLGQYTNPTIISLGILCHPSTRAEVWFFRKG